MGMGGVGNVGKLIPHCLLWHGKGNPEVVGDAHSGGVGSIL